MKNILLLVIFLFYSFKTDAQTTTGVNLEQKIDSVFSAFNNAHSPGVAITVLQKGLPLAKRTFGMANLEHNSDFSHNTPVRLGYSGAREFMCAGIALMVSEGLLRFDEKVKGYFPKLPVWSDNVTVRDLLNHSSGFDDEWATMLLMQASMDNRVDTEQLLTMLYNQPLPQVDPGKGYMYSNSDFALLRLIMEAASRRSLPDYLREKLLEPLGMSSTFMNDNLGDVIPGLADNYFGSGKYSKQVGVKTSPGGNYRIVTTASDLEKWALALEDSASTVAKAFRVLYENARPVPVLSPEVHYLFGHEWQKVGNVDIIKHGGVNGDFYMTRIPSKRITIIGLGNAFNSMATAMSLVNVLLDKKPESNRAAPAISARPTAINKNELKDYTGRYFQQAKPGHSSHIPDIVFYDIKAEGDSLLFYYTSNAFFNMIPVGENLFKDPDYGAIIQFRKTHPDSAQEMQVWAPDGSIMKFKKTKTAAKVSRQYLEQFTGEYHSAHLDFYCRIVLTEDGQLVIRRPTIVDKILIPDDENRFLFEMETDGGGWYVVAMFTKDKKGKVNGINLQHVRMMHHRFEKVR